MNDLRRPGRKLLTPRTGNRKKTLWVFLALLVSLPTGLMYLFGFRTAYVVVYVLPVALAALLRRARAGMVVATSAILLYLIVGGAQTGGVWSVSRQSSLTLQGVSVTLSLLGVIAILRLQLRQSQQDLRDALSRVRERATKLAAAHQRNLELIDEMEEAAREHQAASEALQAAVERNKSLVAGQQRFLDDLAYLEAPVIPLRRDLLLIPMVGVVDLVSAETLGAVVLEQVETRQARTVVFDATGLPLMGDQVAQALIRLMKAMKVMGCQPVVTGLSTANARLLAREEIDLEIKTYQDLQQGVIQLLGATAQV
jgi:anti-anti-sigma regulatory factor